MAIATGGLLFGFGRWHSGIQKQIDAMSEVQLEIAKLQAEKLKLEIQQLSAPTPGNAQLEHAPAIRQASLWTDLARLLLAR